MGNAQGAHRYGVETTDGVYREGVAFALRRSAMVAVGVPGGGWPRGSQGGALLVVARMAMGFSGGPRGRGLLHALRLACVLI
jgi:hypothetical protein